MQGSVDACQRERRQSDKELCAPTANETSHNVVSIIQSQTLIGNFTPSVTIILFIRRYKLPVLMMLVFLSRQFYALIMAVGRKQLIVQRVRAKVRQK
jgi:hypothetical protein